MKIQILISAWKKKILKYKDLLGALSFTSTFICLYFVEIAAQDMQSKNSVYKAYPFC